MSTEEQNRPPNQRQRVYAALQEHPGADRKKLRAVLGMKPKQLSCVLHKMQAEGQIKLHPESGGHWHSRYMIGDTPLRVLSSHQVKRVRPSKPKTKPKAVKQNVTPRRDLAPPRETLQWQMAAPARPGAADHEQIPSRRGDQLVKHQPLMLMGSNVRGEFGK